MRYLPDDLIAGFTVGLTTIPQAIAYGVVAGLEPQYGLYSAFMGCFTYIVFGTCKDITIGKPSLPSSNIKRQFSNCAPLSLSLSATTSIMALMVQPYAIQSADFAPFNAFFVGCIICALGLLNLGVLVRFISLPVITGFTIGAAATIASVQINNLFGIKSPSSKLIPAWKHFFTHLAEIRWPDAVLGLSSLLLILLLKVSHSAIPLSHLGYAHSDLLSLQKAKDIPRGSRTLWKYVALARNAAVVIIGMLLAYFLSRDGHQPFRITGNITAGLPPFRPPPFSTHTRNGTYVPFVDMLQTVGASLASAAMVAILEMVAISKAFCE